MSIVVKGLSKKYDGQLAVDDVSFSLAKGEIVGFLGPNGAGKSTTMKILAGFLAPTEGSASVNGFDLRENPLEAKRSLGYLPENNPLYLEMYVKEFLVFIGDLYNMKGRSLRNRVTEIIDMCGLGPEQQKKIRQLSKGYRQRVGLAQALIHNPKVLILDEPTTGLDPNQLAEIRQLIKNVGSDKTVLFSTHIMQEVEIMCQRVLLINNGKLLADEPLATFRKKAPTLEEAFSAFTKNP